MELIGSDEKVNEVIAFLAGKVDGEDTCMTLENILPTPPEMLIGEGWCRWRIDHWGTKWDVCEPSYDGDTYYFDTAWTTPDKALTLLSKMFPDVEISVKYASEDIGSYCGEYTLENGELTDYYSYDNCSDEAMAFAIEMWECEDDYILTEDGRWVNAEDYDEDEDEVDVDLAEAEAVEVDRES